MRVAVVYYDATMINFLIYKHDCLSDKKFALDCFSDNNTANAMT